MQDDQGQPIEKSPNPVHDGKPYFLGEHALIKFSGGEEGYGPGVYWLVDKDNHTIRPFESHKALQNAFGEGFQDALSNAITVIPPSIDEHGNIHDGVLSDFSVLGPEYSVKEDGTSKPLHFSAHQLRGRYGKEIDEKNENLSSRAMETFMRHLKSHESKTNIPNSFIEKLTNDHQLMAFYVSALAYGEYTLGHIYADINKRFRDSKK